MERNRQHEAFFALLKAGLWEKEVQFFPHEELDFDKILQLAVEQSVIGLVAAGLNHIKNINITKVDMLQFLGHALRLEQHNQNMNSLISRLMRLLEEEQIISVLVKGQGVAQCYLRPQWRSAGDIDLLLDADNYEKAKAILLPLAKSVRSERRTKMHMGMTISSIELELHGTLHSGLSRKLDAYIDKIQDEMFTHQRFRLWENEDTIIRLPLPDIDVIFIFLHILQHFYKGGIGLRQICDWCRLLCTYHESFDYDLLKKRINEMGLMSEWKAFGALAVEYLGTPADYIPFYDKFSTHKTDRLIDYVLETGNFGHNRDISYQSKNYPVIIRKSITLLRQIKENIKIFKIFPKDALLFLNGYVHSQLED